MFLKVDKYMGIKWLGATKIIMMMGGGKLVKESWYEQEYGKHCLCTHKGSENYYLSTREVNIIMTEMWGYK